MANKCITCGRNAESEHCFRCKPRKPLSAKNVKKSQKQGTISLRNDFFLQIWSKRRHFSEISNIYLGREPLSTYFHHILPKEKFPEAEYDEDNIILLTLDEHTNVESNMYKYEEVNKRRDELKLKYERIKQREKERD